MKKYYFLIIVALILGLVLTGCSLLSNISQVPATGQSGVTYLTKYLPPTGLIGLWHFDEGTGTTAYDSSGNSNDGTLYNFASPHGWVSGMFGQALSFDGSDDYVQLPASNTILNTNTFTIETWFKTSVDHPAYGGKEGRLVNLHWKNTASTAVSLYVEEGMIGLLYHKGSMQHKFVTHEVNYFDNMWHHIAVTYNAITYRLYYDGAEVASQDDAFGGFGTYPAYLGTYNGSQRFFNGLIDEVRIWGTALTAEQIGSIIVTMDIKPQSCPNPLNVNSKGVLPIAVLGTEDFDVTQIDPATIELEGVDPLRWVLEDVATPYNPSGEVGEYMCTTDGPDGYQDLTLKFKTQEVVAALGSVEDGDILTLMLTGNLLEEFGETPIVGEDVVLILKKGK